jgi:hypothetical protein
MRGGHALLIVLKWKQHVDMPKQACLLCLGGKEGGEQKKHTQMGIFFCVRGDGQGDRGDEHVNGHVYMFERTPLPVSCFE